MAHERDEYGATFETLTRLRLNDCGDAQSATVAMVSDTDESTQSSTTAERNASTAELDEVLEQTTAGDVTASHEAATTFEAALSAVF